VLLLGEPFARLQRYGQRQTCAKDRGSAGTTVARCEVMTSTARHVVVAYDFSEHGRAVLDRALALVARAPFHVLHFITVLDPKTGIASIPPTGRVDYQYADRAHDELTDAITRAFQTLESAAEIQFFVHARIGSPAEEILGLAKEVGADLIFIGTHGHTGLKHLVMGSVAERVVREAGCPVMVVRPKSYPEVQLQRIVEQPVHKRPASRMYMFSYKNNHVIMRPPEWTTH
jgi:nucleotide-binding universal stress UspA family protein